MRPLSRRIFLGGAASSAVATSSFLHASSIRNSKKNIALIGCGGRAQSHRSEFAKLANITWVCDPDAKRLKDFQGSTGAKGTNDLRRVLDDKDVHAVVIATPDHWHAPAAIMACNAGSMYMSKNHVVITL